jgi:hypothetical protein
MVEDECLKSMSFQEELTVVPPVPNEDVPLPAANGDSHPDEELAGPTEKETPEIVVPEVCAW